MTNEDYENREALIVQFKAICSGINQTVENPWEQVSIAMGVAVYDPKRDHTVNDVVHRADQMMYENKRKKKFHNQET